MQIIFQFLLNSVPLTSTVQMLEPLNTEGVMFLSLITGEDSWKQRVAWSGHCRPIPHPQWSCSLALLLGV